MERVIIRTILLNGYNSPLTAYLHDHDSSGPRIGFSTTQMAPQLNGFSTAIRVKGMPEKKCYSALDTVSYFISASIDRVTKYSDSPVLRKIHKLYSDIVIRLLCSEAMLGAEK